MTQPTEYIRIRLYKVRRLVSSRCTAGDIARQFICAHFTRQRIAVLIGSVYGGSESILCVGDQRRLLLSAIAWQGKCEIWLLPAVTDRDLLQHVAKLIDLERHAMTDARIV